MLWLMEKTFLTNQLKIRTYDNIWKTGQDDDYATGCLQGYVNFKNYYKVIAADLIKQQALYSDPKCNTKN